MKKMPTAIEVATIACGTTTSGFLISFESVAALSNPTQEKIANTIAGAIVPKEAPCRCTCGASILKPNDYQIMKQTTMIAATESASRVRPNRVESFTSL